MFMRYKALIIMLFSALLVVGVVLESCNRKKVDYLGPEYLSAPKDFSATNFTVTDPVNIPVANCFVTATFSTRVTYTVTFKGKSSGATRTYTSVNDHLDASTPGGEWDGTNDGLYLFRSGENVDVTVTFLRSEYTLKKTILLSVQKNYFTNPNLIAVGGINNSYEAAASLVPGNFPFQFAFSNASGPNAFVDKTPAATFGVKAIHGLNVLRFTGISNQIDGYFIGGIQHRKGNPNTNSTFMLPVAWTDPSQIYFNIYMYGNGASNAIVNLELHESDASNPANGGGKNECGGQVLNAFDHDPCTDDGWVYAQPVNFSGWRLISVKFSDFSKSVSSNNGGSGDVLKEPTRIARIQMGVVASPAFKEASVMMDYPVMSYGAPFDPSK